MRIPVHEAAYAHAQQPDALLQWHTLETLACHLADQARILREGIDADLPRHTLEAGIAQLHTNSAPGIALAL